MAMALQLGRRVLTQGSTTIDMVLSTGYGVLNGIVLDKAPLGFLFMNIIVPVAGFFVPIPRSIQNASLNNLGIILGVLLFGKK